tara:strand:- start:234 stop:1028 length:795 start_codon:yes stop_codon:yes gene_type:complete
MLGLGIGSFVEGGSAISGLPAYYLPVTNTKSLDVDGTNDYLDTNYNSNDLCGSSASFSVSAWVKPDDGQTSLADAIIGAEKSVDSAFIFYNSPAGKLSVWFQSNGNTASGDTSLYSTDSAVWANEESTWKHAVATVEYVDGGNAVIKIYVNGSEAAGSYLGGFRVDSTHYAAFDTGNLNFFIGANNDDGSHADRFEGLIDEVSVFTKVLSATEVSNIYNSGTPTNLVGHPGLLLYYRFEDNANDSNGTSNGTLVNGPTYSSTTP